MNRMSVGQQRHEPHQAPQRVLSWGGALALVAACLALEKVGVEDMGVFLPLSEFRVSESNIRGVCPALTNMPSAEIVLAGFAAEALCGRFHETMACRNETLRRCQDGLHQYVPRAVPWKMFTRIHVHTPQGWRSQ